MQAKLRIVILSSGVALLVIAVAFLLLGAAPIFTLPVGALVMILGIVISPPPGVTSGEVQGGPVSIVVDKAVLGTSIYQLFFFNARLVLKRLATAKTTFFSILILAVVGFTIDRLIGALAGVAVGYAFQEYTTQNNRLKDPISTSSFKLRTGDIEVPYDDLEKVQLRKNRLILFSTRGITKIGLPRGYGAKMGPGLKGLLAGKFEVGELVHSADASGEQNK